MAVQITAITANISDTFEPSNEKVKAKENKKINMVHRIISIIISAIML